MGPSSRTKVFNLMLIARLPVPCNGAADIVSIIRNRCRFIQPIHELQQIAVGAFVVADDRHHAQRVAAFNRVEREGLLLRLHAGIFGGLQQLGPDRRRVVRRPMKYVSRKESPLVARLLDFGDKRPHTLQLRLLALQLMLQLAKLLIQFSADPPSGRKIANAAIRFASSSNPALRAR